MPYYEFHEGLKPFSFTVYNTVITDNTHNPVDCTHFNMAVVQAQ